MSRADVVEDDEPANAVKTGGEVVRFIAGCVGLACFRLQPVKSLDSLQDMWVGHAFRLQL